jgi:hypothetical protein
MRDTPDNSLTRRSYVSEKQVAMTTSETMTPSAQTKTRNEGSGICDLLPFAMSATSYREEMLLRDRKRRSIKSNLKKITCIARLVTLVSHTVKWNEAEIVPSCGVGCRLAVPSSEPAEPVVTLVFPIAAGVVILHIERGDIFWILEPELGRDADLDREPVGLRQGLVIEFEC